MLPTTLLHVARRPQIRVLLCPRVLAIRFARPFGSSLVAFHQHAPRSKQELQEQHKLKSIPIKEQGTGVRVTPPSQKDVEGQTIGHEKASPAANAAVLSQLSNIPNLITLSRIASIPFIGYFLATGQSTPAIGLFAYACVSDFVDGYIARKYDLATAMGSILDPVADKFLMTTCTVALSINSTMPLYVAGVIIGRDVMLSFIAIFLRYRALPPPKTLGRMADLSIPTHSVHPNLLGKVNTALQMVYIGGLVIQPWLVTVVPLATHGAFDWFGAIVAATTFCSGMSYVLRMNSFKAITK